MSQEQTQEQQGEPLELVPKASEDGAHEDIVNDQHPEEKIRGAEETEEGEEEEEDMEEEPFGQDEEGIDEDVPEGEAEEGDDQEEGKEAQAEKDGQDQNNEQTEKKENSAPIDPYPNISRILRHSEGASSFTFRAAPLTESGGPPNFRPSLFTYNQNRFELAQAKVDKLRDGSGRFRNRQQPRAQFAQSAQAQGARDEQGHQRQRFAPRRRMPSWNRMLPASMTDHEVRIESISRTEWVSILRGQLGGIAKLSHSGTVYNGKDLEVNGAIRNFVSHRQGGPNLNGKVINLPYSDPFPATPVPAVPDRVRSLASSNNIDLTGSAAALAALAALPHAAYGVQLGLTVKDGQLSVDFLPGSAAAMLTVNENLRLSGDEPELPPVHPAIAAARETVLNKTVIEAVSTGSGEGAEICRLLEPTSEDSGIRVLVHGVVPTQTKVISSTNTNNGEGLLGMTTTRTESIARCGIHIVSEVSIPGAQSWRAQLKEGNTVDILLETLRNNSFRFIQFLCQQFLLGATQCVILFASPAKGENNSSYTILASREMTVEGLGSMLNFPQKRMWGVLERFTRDLTSKPNGEYVLIKESFDSSYHIFNRSDVLGKEGLSSSMSGLEGGLEHDFDD